jgi:hypothetical protein
MFLIDNLLTALVFVSSFRVLDVMVKLDIDEKDVVSYVETIEQGGYSEETTASRRLYQFQSKNNSEIILERAENLHRLVHE